MISIEDVDKQLQHIARQVVQKAKDWRVEFDDMLQEARITAWQAITRGNARGLKDEELRRYALGAARNECERIIASNEEDLLYHCDNYGLAEDLSDGN